MAISNNKKEKLQQFAHILAGFLILVHALDKYDLHQSSYFLFAVLGLIFIGIAIFHHKLAAMSGFVDSAFLIIEALCVAVIAVEYYNEGKKGLPWCYAFAAVMYVIAAVLVYRRKAKKK
jgi:hypothetical protein